MSRWLGRGAVLAVFMATALPMPAVAGTACDLEALKHYPMAAVIATRISQLQTPAIFFRDPSDKSDSSFLFHMDRNGEAKARAALARGLKTFPPIERPVLMLAVTSSWTTAENGFVNFFVGEPGIYIDEVLATLDAEGLTEHAAIIRRGRALFGPDYGTQEERRSRWTDGHGHTIDVALDAKLRALSSEFHALPDLVDEAETRIMHRPELKAIYERLKANATNTDRLGYLTNGLMVCFADAMSDDKEDSLLDRLPSPYARILLVSIFEFEMLNGSVEQFFYNSSGRFAPRVVTALTDFGLKKHAEAIQHGIDLFPQPYPTDMGARREFMLERRESVDTALEDLTDIVNDGEIEPAMIRTAREADILPK
jgi:hypothetical protein